MISSRNFQYNLDDSSSYYDSQYKRRGNSLHASQSQPKLSSRQTVNMMRLLDRYSNPSYSSELTPKSKSSYQDSQRKHHKLNRGSFNKKIDESDTNQFGFGSPLSPTNSRFHQMLEKELYSLKADLSRLKALELEQNKKYESQVYNMMKQNQRYPPPNVLFGGASSPQMPPMGQPLFFF